MLDDGDNFFFALNTQGHVTAFQADIGSEELAVLRANRARLQHATTTEDHYQTPSRRSLSTLTQQASCSIGPAGIRSPVSTSPPIGWR